MENQNRRKLVKRRTTNLMEFIVVVLVQMYYVRHETCW